MIKGLYETHLSVENLERSIDFYKNVLGLEFAMLEEKRRIAFFWIGQPKEYMLGFGKNRKQQLKKDILLFVAR